MVTISLDKTGFPLITIDGLGVMQLWPVTKLQIERFISDTNQLGDHWYDAILSGNPRTSYRFASERNYEGLFATGILPNEALNFANWLGQGFDLPTVDEWRNAYKQFQAIRKMEIDHAKLGGPSSLIWQAIQTFAVDSLNYSFMNNGLIELVRADYEKYSGLGSPRAQFHPNVRDPLVDPPVEFISSDARIRHVGFRLIKRQ